MANWQATNVNTGQTELPKFNVDNVTAAVYSVALTTALALNDVILGPVVPAGVFITDVVVDVPSLDSNATKTIAFECGYAGALAAFIAAGNATAQLGGIAHANVPGTVGTTFTAATAVQVQITAGAATALAGTMRIAVFYTASP